MGIHVAQVEPFSLHTAFLIRAIFVDQKVVQRSEPRVLVVRRSSEGLASGDLLSKVGRQKPSSLSIWASEGDADLYS